MFIVPPPARLVQPQGASAEAIKAYCATNFHDIKPHHGVRSMCGVKVARVQEGQEIRLGDFIRYYSSMLDAFTVEQIVDIGDDHITLLWIDGDGCVPFKQDMEKVYPGKAGDWWHANQNIWGAEVEGNWREHSTECYSLWRPVDLIAAAKSCRRPHESEYFPFMSGGRGPSSYTKRDVYTQQFQPEDWVKVKEESSLTALTLSYNVPGKKLSLWQRALDFVINKFI